jgi:hypothetical protein
MCEGRSDSAFYNMVGRAWEFVNGNGDLIWTQLGRRGKIESNGNHWCTCLNITKFDTRQISAVTQNLRSGRHVEGQKEASSSHADIDNIP